MAYFDFLAGITKGTANALVQEFYSTAPQSTADNPFNGETQQDVDSLGTVTLDWSFQNDLSVKFGTPSAQDWNNALGPTGQSNGSAGIGLPTSPMVQLSTSFFQASYTLSGDQTPHSGSSSLTIYATITADSGQATLTTAAILLQNSTGFSDWNSSVFNEVLVSQVFNCGDAILQAVQFPPFDLPGLPLGPVWAVEIAQDCLLGATVLPGNGSVILSDFTPPQDQAFALISSDALNKMINLLADQFDDLPIGGEVAYQDLANCTLDAQTSEPTGAITIDNLNPLTCHGEITVWGSAYIDVTDKGLGTGGEKGPQGQPKGGFNPCDLLPWYRVITHGKPALSMQAQGLPSEADDGGVTFKYQMAPLPSALQVYIQAELDDESLKLTAVGCDTPDFNYTADASNQAAIGELQSQVLDPSLNLLSQTYESTVPAAVKDKNRGIVLNEDSTIGDSNKLIARQLAFGEPVYLSSIPSQAMKITCNLSVVAL